MSAGSTYIEEHITGASIKTNHKQEFKTDSHHAVVLFRPILTENVLTSDWHRQSTLDSFYKMETNWVAFVVF